MTSPRYRSRAGDRWRLVAAFCGLALVIAVFFNPLSKHFDSSEWLSSGGCTPLENLSDRFREGSAAKGFHVQILSEPSAAEVIIQGKSRGRTPFFGNVQCRAEEEVIFEVTSKGFRPWVRNPLCREGGTLEINARLEPLP